MRLQPQLINNWTRETIHNWHIDKTNKDPPPLKLDISNEQEHESFESTFNYCIEIKDDLNENNKLIEENQKLKQILEKQQQEIGQIEYIHKTKNLFFSKGINHENNLYLFEDLIKELKLNSVNNWSAVKTYFFTTGTAYSSIFRIS